MEDPRAQCFRELRRLESLGHEGLQYLFHENRETAEGGIDAWIIWDRTGQVLASA